MDGNPISNARISFGWDLELFFLVVGNLWGICSFKNEMSQTVLTSQTASCLAVLPGIPCFHFVPSVAVPMTTWNLRFRDSSILLKFLPRKKIKDPISCDMAMTVVKVRARARNLFLLHIQTIQPNLFNPFEWWTHGIDGIHSSELFGNWRWGEVRPSKFHIGNPRGVVMWTFLDSLHLCCTRHFVWTDGGQAWKHIFPKKFSTKTMDSLRILKLISMIPSGITYEVLFGEITTADEPRSWEAETHGAWENRT